MESKITKISLHVISFMMAYVVALLLTFALTSCGGVEDPAPPLLSPVPGKQVKYEPGVNCSTNSDCITDICTGVSCNKAIRMVCAEEPCDIYRPYCEGQSSCVYAGKGRAYCVPKSVCD